MFLRGVVLAAALAVTAGCGGGGGGEPDVISAGQLDIKLPPGWTVTEDGARRPAVPAGGDEPVAAAAPSTDDTVPLAEEDPSSSFFGAANKFQQCLEDLGVTFIGAPDPSSPDSPTNDPDYLDDLGTCASKSNIVKAMEGFNQAQSDLTPEEIEEQNESYLEWRDCMIARGWKIAEPTPDAQGRLISLGAGGGNAPQIEGPPGESLLNSDDMRECAGGLGQ